MTDDKSRAVLRPVDAGLDLQEECKGCGDTVLFLARIPSRLRKRVVANVYADARWDHVEIWHTVCYVRHGMPYGLPVNLSDQEAGDIIGLADAMPFSDQREVLDALVALYRSRNMQVFAGP